MGNAAIALPGPGDGRELVSPIVGLAARTEQQGMTGRSIETSVERRHARRQQLNLRMADRPMLA